ncbi:MAG: sigma-70 family RNA polymerase sigma factor [Phycisphaeraceae bacterium]|nr:MAG: sigma-70 family RNA polymerase sigma factor [Phycisphaeraceae bacterium]
MNDRPRQPDGDITRLLGESAAGSTNARDRLVEIVYAELHAMAKSRLRSERPDHTLGATGLVNETYMRLFRVAGEGVLPPFSDRAAFFSAAATAMRRVLVDHARGKAAVKRGGPRSLRGSRVSLDALDAAESLEPQELLSLDEAISRLEQVDERAARVVRLRFYAGQSVEAIAEMLEVSDRTIKRDWEFARAWLRQALGAIEQETTGS